ncbi:hypothetical protein PCYB_002310 [Plasmodium cynomolgi strain B]|uniref:CYIR protein n=1 Tax=Plasmodium cynomolgi (strain B) TaxID=1120755 RepID=K6VJC1_PLACD|nr:hypothetical protein PCYB_002310 [Plasmodium cynomolgi strain B]GAB69482.1 hypothetical protein PCYB_002310 [Plasmodium cynomolgi strain B]
MLYKTKYNLEGSYEKHKNEIEINSESSTYVSECREFKSQYGSYNIFNDDITCKKVMIYLNFIGSYGLKSTYNDSRCKYLYYWIYEDLLKKNNNYDEAFKFYTIFLTAYFDNEGDDPHICKKYKEESEKIVLEKSAKLIELYETFNNNGERFNCDCAKKCSELYTKYVKEFNNDSDYDFCIELENFKHKYEEKVKSIESSCDAEKILPSVIKHDKLAIEQGLGNIITTIIILTILFFLLFVLYKVK